MLMISGCGGSRYVIAAARQPTEWAHLVANVAANQPLRGVASVKVVYETERVILA